MNMSLIKLLFISNLNMENKKTSCLCRNSIKMQLLDYLNSIDAPIEIFKLIHTINQLIRKTNPDLNLDDNFLNTYVQTVIEDFIEMKAM
jgi:hypothetical protein